jgi:hypothetical protein
VGHKNLFIRGHYVKDLILHLLCVLQHESEWDERAVGSHGEIGLFQILPSTGHFVASKLGLTQYDLFDVQDNTTLGLWILEHHPSWFSTWEHCQDEVGKLDQQTP